MSLRRDSGWVERCLAISVTAGPRVESLVEGVAGFFFADDLLHLGVAGVAEGVGVEGGGAGEEFVEEDAEGVDVGAGVDFEA